MAEDFNDIDLLVLQEGVPAARQILDAMGRLKSFSSNPRYQSEAFIEYGIQGLELDLIGGVGMVDGGIIYDCSLKPQHIAEKIKIAGATVPLMDPRLWIDYYRKMHRPEKAERIIRFLGNRGRRVGTGGGRISSPAITESKSRRGSRVFGRRA